MRREVSPFVLERAQREVGAKALGKPRGGDLQLLGQPQRVEQLDLLVAGEVGRLQVVEEGAQLRRRAEDEGVEVRHGDARAGPVQREGELPPPPRCELDDAAGRDGARDEGGRGVHAAGWGVATKKARCPARAGGGVAGSLLLFRNFEHEDLFEVVRLANRSLNETYDGGLFLQLGDLYPDGFIVAEARDGIHGFLLGVVERAYEARVLILAVDERARGRGIGARLVRLFEERFLARGIRRINLEVRVTNASAIRLYEKLGFEKRKVLPAYYADGEDAYLMTKLIA